MVTSNVINGLIDNSKNNGNISSTTKNDKSNSSLDVNDFYSFCCTDAVSGSA